MRHNTQFFVEYFALDLIMDDEGKIILFIIIIFILIFVSISNYKWMEVLPMKI